MSIFKIGDTMLLKDCNPFIRIAQTQPAVLERTGPRKAYDYRLFYILENSGIILIEGVRYDIGPDTMIVIPPATAYDFQGRLKTCVLNFDITQGFSHRTQAQFPPREEEFDPNSLFETELLEGFERPCVLQGDISARDTVLRIINQFNTHGIYAGATTSALLKLLLCELLSRSTDPKEKLSEKVMSYIRTHAASINGNEDVAQAFGYHPVYLGELIRHTTGKTLHAAITEAKLQLACRWLAGTEESIDDIAHLAGFCSRAHFCTLFKKKLGVSPTQYRKRNTKAS